MGSFYALSQLHRIRGQLLQSHNKDGSEHFFDCFLGHITFVASRTTYEVSIWKYGYLIRLQNRSKTYARRDITAPTADELGRLGLEPSTMGHSRVKERGTRYKKRKAILGEKKKKKKNMLVPSGRTLPLLTHRRWRVPRQWKLLGVDPVCIMFRTQIALITYAMLRWHWRKAGWVWPRYISVYAVQCTKHIQRTYLRTYRYL